MKFVWVIFFLFGLCQGAEESKKRPYEFFQEEAKEKSLEPPYLYNQYENIISGGFAFVVGNIGYFTTDSNALKFAYSFIQTIGLINVGQGIYDYYRPSTEQEYSQLLSGVPNSGQPQIQNYFASGLVKILAQEERAKRLSLFYTSSLLAVQYGINIGFDNNTSDLRDIFYFLGGVNVIVAVYTFFSQGDYEKYYYQEESTYDIRTVMIRTPEGRQIPGVGVRVVF